MVVCVDRSARCSAVAESNYTCVGMSVHRGCMCWHGAGHMRVHVVDAVYFRLGVIAEGHAFGRLHGTRHPVGCARAPWRRRWPGSRQRKCMRGSACGAAHAHVLAARRQLSAVMCTRAKQQPTRRATYPGGDGGDGGGGGGGPLQGLWQVAVKTRIALA